MKRLLLPFCGLMLLAACGGGKSDADENKDTLDTVVDSLALMPEEEEDPIIAQTPVPKAADGVFYDFIASFCQNRKYQKSRVQFPLTHTINGQAHTVSAEEWRFSKLHYNSDIYTVFFPNAKSLSLETSKKVERVSVNWYDMNSSTASKYQFEKIDQQWMLTSIDEHPVSEDSDADFVNFYSAFASDASFQTSHLAETLTYDGVDLDNDDEFDTKMVKGKKIPASQWSEALIPELPGTQFSNIDFGQDLTGSERMVSVECPSSGFTSRLYFRKGGDSWQLFKIENY